MSTSQSIPSEVTRAEFARMRRMDMSYVCRLAKKGRLVLTPDGKRVKVAESIALLADTSDPSKEGVRERFAELRAPDDGSGELPLGASGTLNASGAEPGDSGGTARIGSMNDARRELIQEQAARAKLLREKEEGRLVDAEEVRNATFEKARVARNALFGMIDTISSRLAAETNAAKVHEILTTEITRVCEELSAGESQPTRQ